MPMKTNEREYRNFELRAMDVTEEDKKIVRGYASTFNDPYTLYEDADYTIREQVDPHAFDEADMSDVVFLRDHTGQVYARTKNGLIDISIDEKDRPSAGARKNLDFLRRALYDNDIDQNALSKKLGIDVETIDYWFRHDKCYISYFFQIAKYTGMKLKIDIRPLKR